MNKNIFVKIIFLFFVVVFFCCASQTAEDKREKEYALTNDSINKILKELRATEKHKSWIRFLKIKQSLQDLMVVF